MRVPVKSQRSPACAVSTASALRTISRERGMEPRGSSACVSWIRTWTHKSRTQSETSEPTLLSLFSSYLHTPSYLLEVNELGFVCVKMEAGAIVAHRVSADGWWGVLKLLGDIFDHCLAVHAQEGAADLKPHGSHNEQTGATLLYLCITAAVFTLVKNAALQHILSVGLW